MLVRNVRLAIVFASLVSALGCGGDALGRKAVTGAVNVDGSPLQKGSIRFQPLDQGVGSGAPIDAGKYAIAQKAGLPPGKYLVVINAPVPGTGGSVDSSAPPGEAPPPPKELIPEDWNEKSTHSVEISASGKNEHNFDVQTKKK